MKDKYDCVNSLLFEHATDEENREIYDLQVRLRVIEEQMENLKNEGKKLQKIGRGVAN